MHHSKNIEYFLSKLHHNSKLMCLDLGFKKIGIAISDIRKVIANPYSVLYRKNTRKDIGIIYSYIVDLNIDGLVIGYPAQVDEHEKYHDSCNFIEQFTKKIIQKLEYHNLAVPIIFHDESCSTNFANQYLEAMRYKSKKRDCLDDKVAASVILQDFLNILNKV